MMGSAENRDNRAAATLPQHQHIVIMRKDNSRCRGTNSAGICMQLGQ